MALEDLMDMFRPEVTWGRMEADADKCDGCGLCVENCPGKSWEIGEDELAHFLADRGCFSCFNCQVACPNQAISSKEVYHVKEGFFRTDPSPLPVKMPQQPRDAEDHADEFTEVEKAVLERRSVRNFKKTPVPEPLIRRVIEAGRFAPSGGNCQPWKFMVITDTDLLAELGNTIRGAMGAFIGTYNNDQALPLLAKQFEANPMPGMFDKRFIYGATAISDGALPPFLNAPAVIIILGDDRAIGGAPINIGSAGENMCLVANSLGLGSCWVGFSLLINMIPPLKEKLGIEPPWQVVSSIALGYPAFRQQGMVPREYRPVTWFRPGKRRLKS